MLFIKVIQCFQNHHSIHCIVDVLLSSNIKVVIYNGQLDLIVDTLGINSYNCVLVYSIMSTGTMNWVQKLEWSGLKSFLNTKRIPIYPPSRRSLKDTGAFLQFYENLYFYWILKAGHMVSHALKKYGHCDAYVY